MFSNTGKSGWFVVPENQHVFSHGRTVELVAFGNAEGDAVETDSDPGFDYIGTISVRGLHETPLKGKFLSEVLPEEYLRFSDEVRGRVLEDLKRNLIPRSPGPTDSGRCKGVRVAGIRCCRVKPSH